MMEDGADAAFPRQPHSSLKNSAHLRHQNNHHCGRDIFQTFFCVWRAGVKCRGLQSPRCRMCFFILMNSWIVVCLCVCVCVSVCMYCCMSEEATVCVCVYVLLCVIGSYCVCVCLYVLLCVRGSYCVCLCVCTVVCHRKLLCVCVFVCGEGRV